MKPPPFDREETARRRDRAAPRDAELTEPRFGGAACVERVRSEIERVPLLLVRLRATTESVRALEQRHAPPSACQIRRDGKPPKGRRR